MKLESGMKYFNQLCRPLINDSNNNSHGAAPHSRCHDVVLFPTRFNSFAYVCMTPEITFLLCEHPCLLCEHPCLVCGGILLCWETSCGCPCLHV